MDRSGYDIELFQKTYHEQYEHIYHENYSGRYVDGQCEASDEFEKLMQTDEFYRFVNVYCDMTGDTVETDMDESAFIFTIRMMRGD